EDAHLALFPLPLDARGLIQRLVQNGHELRPVSTGGVKCSDLDQSFQDALVDFVQIDPAAEIKEGPERSFRVTDRNDRLNRPFADVLDRGQSEANAAFNHGEILLTFIEIRRQYLDAQVAAFGE